jgi:hypothetical protein
MLYNISEMYSVLKTHTPYEVIAAPEHNEQ